MDQKVVDDFIAKIPHMTVEKKVAFYLKAREAKSAAKRKFDAEDAQYKLLMDTVENFLLRDADDSKVDGFTLKGLGTVYTTETVKISIADDTAFETFLNSLPPEENKFLFFERRISSTHVAAYMKTHDGTAPAGLNLFRERVARVRKANEKGDK